MLVARCRINKLTLSQRIAFAEIVFHIILGLLIFFPRFCYFPDLSKCQSLSTLVDSKSDDDNEDSAATGGVMKWVVIEALRLDADQEKCLIKAPNIGTVTTEVDNCTSADHHNGNLLETSDTDTDRAGMDNSYLPKTSDTDTAKAGMGSSDLLNTSDTDFVRNITSQITAIPALTTNQSGTESHNVIRGK